MYSSAPHAPSPLEHPTQNIRSSRVTVVVLHADRISGQAIARQCAALGWPLALHYCEVTSALEDLIVDIWDSGGVVQAFERAG